MLSFNRKELIDNSQVEFDETLRFSLEALKDNNLIKDLKEVRIKGKGYYQRQLDIFAVEATASGIMIVPCAVTLQDVEYPYSCELRLVYSFLPTSADQEIAVPGDIVDLKPEIFQAIVAEIPLKVRAPGSCYPKGQNWEVISEATYLAEKENAVDPRLQALKNYKFEDNEEE